ncbi:MAG: phage major capsid protein [Verrucomicrobiota bacterium]
MRTLIRLLFLTSLLPLAAMAQEDPAAQAAQAKANEQRLRDTLRVTTQQLRTAETEKATLLAGQTERDQKIADLEARVKAITQQANDDKTKADQSIAEFKATENKAGLEIARLTSALEKWKAAYNQAAGLVRTTETMRARLDSANVGLERKVADRERQNLELYKTASEILQRYRDFGLGRAIAAREPFTGIAKVKIEEQVQDYSDKLEDNKLKPEPSDGKPSTQPAPAGKPVSGNPKTSPKTK